jgi:hypothetical protein
MAGELTHEVVDPIAFDDVVSYVVAYCERYRQMFDSFTDAPPSGHGLPKVPHPP